MKRLTMVSAYAVGLIGLTGSVALSGKPVATINFSHKFHLVEAGAKCEQCHKNAATATSASVNLLPRMEDCYACHDPNDTDCAKCHNEPAVRDRKYSPYVAPARELTFSHARHVDSLKIECNVCHGAIASADKAPSRALPAMDLCVECHRSRQIKDDCSVCHSHVELRRPDDHGPDWVLDHVEKGRRDARSCETCHKQTYCQECHDGAALGLAVRGKKDAPADRVAPLATAEEGNDLLILQRRHNPNYLYTHGAEVRSKVSDCAVCHETESFCAACHNPETDPTRLRPIWHDVPSFNTTGHAEQARKDIETCAACHDQSAAEPNCIRCHSERSNLSPHPAGFMHDIHGPWHNGNDAVCFVCHDPGSRQPGVGFCGKCHGGEHEGGED